MYTCMIFDMCFDSTITALQIHGRQVLFGHSVVVTGGYKLRWVQGRITFSHYGTKHSTLVPLF